MSQELKQLKQQMIAVYGIQCWLSGIEDNRLTGHHIIPVRHKGKTTWDNIALLSKEQHELFNLIERKDVYIANQLNDLFYELNQSFSKPTEDYFKEVNKVKCKFRR